jgi:cyclophilin family peptidyl-prolyl cis-trans isomerase
MTSKKDFDGTLLTGKHTIVLKTSMGPVTIELNADKAPKTVTNFIVHAQNGYYDELTFHRVIPDFMIQGGDPSGNGTGGNSIYGDSFEDEHNDLQMSRGVIAMANSGPHTNGSQFFITVIDASWLQGRHTVFGQVTQGMDIVDTITMTSRDQNDKPRTPITFTPEVKK